MTRYDGTLIVTLMSIKKPANTAVHEKFEGRMCCAGAKDAAGLDVSMDR